MGFFALAGIFAECFILAQLLATLSDRLTVKIRYSLVREFDHYRTELRIALIYSPFMAAITATVAGVGVNLATDGDVSRGVDLILLAFVFTYQAGSFLLKNMHYNEREWWLRRALYQLHSFADIQSTPPNHFRTLAEVCRLKRVGERLVNRADHLTLRRWIRNDKPAARRLCGVWLASLLYPIDLLVYGDPNLEFWLIVSGIIFILAPFAVVLRLNSMRWWYRRAGKELTDRARRAELSLVGRSVPGGYWHRIRCWWDDRPRYRSRPRDM